MGKLLAIITQPAVMQLSCVTSVPPHSSAPLLSRLQQTSNIYYTQFIVYKIRNPSNLTRRTAASKNNFASMLRVCADA